MNDTAKVCAALRACDECDPHGDNVLAGCHSCRFLAAVAEVVERAQEMRDGYQLVLGGSAFDEAIRRAAEVCG